MQILPYSFGWIDPLKLDLTTLSRDRFFSIFHVCIHISTLIHSNSFIRIYKYEYITRVCVSVRRDRDTKTHKRENEYGVQGGENGGVGRIWTGGHERSRVCPEARMLTKLHHNPKCFVRETFQTAFKNLTTEKSFTTVLHSWAQKPSVAFLFLRGSSKNARARWATGFPSRETPWKPGG